MPRATAGPKDRPPASSSRGATCCRRAPTCVAPWRPREKQPRKRRSLALRGHVSRNSNSASAIAARRWRNSGRLPSFRQGLLPPMLCGDSSCWNKACRGMLRSILTGRGNWMRLSARRGSDAGFACCASGNMPTPGPRSRRRPRSNRKPVCFAPILARLRANWEMRRRRKRSSRWRSGLTPRIQPRGSIRRCICGGKTGSTRRFAIWTPPPT